MRSVLKFSLIFLGGFLVGFGTAMIGLYSFVLDLEEASYWLVVVISLVSGGFLTALGLVIRQRSRDKKEEEKKEKDKPTPEREENLINKEA